jgi:flagellar hook-associated protein 2
MATTVSSVTTAPPLQGTITSNGVGSGIDVHGIVQKLVTAEGTPQSTRLDAAEADVQAKLSALGSLRSALSGFQDSLAKVKDLATFEGRTVVLSSEDFFSATASSSAVPASYSIEVEQLAQAQKLQSTSFASTSTAVGTGTLTITSGGQTFDVVIDSTNNTVAGIAAAINSSDAADKVVATVINGANGTATLTLTARTTGTANALTLTQTGGDGGLAVLQYPKSGGSGLTQIIQPLDAKAKIDGVEVTSATNSIVGAIDGVQINLKQANDPGATSNVTVQYDQPGAHALVDSLVKNYNVVVDAVNSVASYDASTQKAGPLFGDLGVNNLVDQLRRALGSPVAGVDSSVNMLTKIGITFDLDGHLSVDETKLDAALAANFKDVGKLFADSEVGIGVGLGSLLDPYLKSGGVFDGRNDSLKASISNIDDQRQQLNDRLDALQARYLTQFNALDTLLAQMQSTSSFLTQQLANLPGFTFSDGKKSS